MGDENKDKPPFDYDKLADILWDKFINKIYHETGKGVLKKIFWILVFTGIGLAIGTGNLPSMPVSPTK